MVISRRSDYARNVPPSAYGGEVAGDLGEQARDYTIDQAMRRDTARGAFAGQGFLSAALELSGAFISSGCRMLNFIPSVPT